MKTAIVIGVGPDPDSVPIVLGRAWRLNDVARHQTTGSVRLVENDPTAVPRLTQALARSLDARNPCFLAAIRLTVADPSAALRFSIGLSQEEHKSHTIITQSVV